MTYDILLNCKILKLMFDNIICRHNLDHDKVGLI